MRRSGASGVSDDGVFSDTDFDDSDLFDSDVTATGADDDGSGTFSEDAEPTVSSMLSAASESDVGVGKSRSSGAAKRIRKLTGRLGFGDGAGETGSIDSRLTSVVNESTPGPALDLLRGNSSFALPELDAWVMLVLPTVGEFGGLSKRSRGEDKGQFIQMINTELVDAVVTTELLADDALGLVPTPGSLGRMKEFGMLTDARYVFGVACADVDSGGVKVFAVPAVEEEDATKGRVFAKVEQVSMGKLALSALVDPRVVAAMLAIYRDPKLDPGQGDTLLDEAVQANMELMVDEVARGRYPTPGEFVNNLDARFPGAGIRGAAQQAHGVADEPVVAAVAETTEPEPSTDADVVADDDRDQDSTAAGADTEGADAQVTESDLDDGPEPDFAGDTPEAHDDDEPDFADPGLDDDDSDPVPVPQAVDQAGMRALLEAIESLREDVRTRDTAIEHTPGGVPVGVPTQSGPAPVVPGSEFTYDQALAAAGRRYINEDLDLYIDPSPFLQRLTWAAPSLDVPVTGVTPWLGEQVQTWIAVLDENIKTYHEEAIRNLYRRYTQLADEAAATTNAEFDPRSNESSSWGQAYAALEQDRLSLAGRADADRVAAEDRARQQWDVRRKAYIEDAAARAAQEFEHRNATRIEADVRDAGERVIASAEALHEHNLAQFNDMRRRAAQVFMDDQISYILSQLDAEAQTMQEMNRQMVEAAATAVREYLDDNRQNDLDQAAATERRLAADTRLEEARAEASEQIAKIRAEADERVAAMAEDMRRRSAETVEQLKINEETTALQIGREQARIQVLESRLEQMESDATERIERMREHHLQELESNQREARDARAAKDRILAEQQRRATISFWAMVAGIVVAIVLGALAGYVFANGLG